MTTDLTDEQRATMREVLSNTAPATGEQVRRALSDVRSVSGHSHRETITERLTRAGEAVPAIVRALLDAEAEVQRLKGELGTAVATVTELVQQREKVECIANAERAKNADREDALSHALGRKGMDWSELLEVATSSMQLAEGIEAAQPAELKKLRARVAELEALPELFRATWRGGKEAPTRDYAEAWKAAEDAKARGERDAGVTHYGRTDHEYVPSPEMGDGSE